MKAFKIILIAIIASLTLYACHESLQQQQSPIVLRSLPFVQASVNGEQVWLLIDTGASLSLIDSAFVANNSMIAKKRSVKRLSYISGALQVSNAIEADVVISNGKTQIDMFVDDISNITSQLSIALGHQVVGILGCDYLTKAGSLIDINNCRLYMLKVSQHTINDESDSLHLNANISMHDSL